MPTARQGVDFKGGFDNLPLPDKTNGLASAEPVKAPLSEIAHVSGAELTKQLFGPETFWENVEEVLAPVGEQAKEIGRWMGRNKLLCGAIAAGLTGTLVLLMRRR